MERMKWKKGTDGGASAGGGGGGGGGGGNGEREAVSALPFSAVPQPHRGRL